MRYLTKAFGIIAVLSLMAGCQTSVANQNKELYAQTHELQTELDQARAQLAAAQAAKGDPGQIAALQQQIATKDAQIAQLQNDAAKPASGVQPGLEGVSTTYDAAAETITAAIPGDVLFAPGAAELKPSASASLTKIVKAIEKQYAGKSLYIDGHTDSDPISRTKADWDDNWDLSYARAKAVTAYLINNGINPKLIVVRAFGENQPKSTKQASRRVEIVVVVK